MKFTEVDVLIIGAGPAGLVASLWMARAGINTILIDQKSEHTGKGHADGVEARTFEILDSFGLGEKCWSEANHTLEVCIWNRTPEGMLFRESVAANGSVGSSRYHEGTLAQGRIEEHILSVLSNSSVQILRQTTPTMMEIDSNSINDLTSHPVTVKLETRSMDGTTLFETVKSRYVLGCDGAHSWVRKQVGLKMEGNSVMESWGVIDCIPITDFPDLRKRSIIKTKQGSMMIIPRERRLCRIYVQLSQDGARSYKTHKRSDIIVETIQGILEPYEFRTNIIEWYTVYSAGHRVCPQASVLGRIFLAGDALHTHSAKAGKGMNLSMQDTFNLGWKLASVLRGVANPSVLKTYSLERMQTAQKLVAFDRQLYREISIQGQDPKGLRQVLRDDNTLESGMAVVYPTSSITASPGSATALGTDVSVSNKLSCPYKSLGQRLIVGGRIPSAPLIRQSDVRPVELQQLLPATGQWHLLVFGGDISEPGQMGQTQELASKITAGRWSRLFNATPGKHVIGTIKGYLLHSAPRLRIEQHQIPRLFLPVDDNYGYDYDRVYADSCSPSALSTYQKFAIPAKGCMVLVRPDQHISLIASLQEYSILEAFLSRMIPISHTA